MFASLLSHSSNRSRVSRTTRFAAFLLDTLRCGRCHSLAVKLTAQRSNITNITMRVLPIVRVGDKIHFHDERLKQYRNVEKWYDCVDYAYCDLCFEGNCPHTYHARYQFHCDSQTKEHHLRVELRSSQPKCKHEEVVIYVDEGKPSIAICQACGKKHNADRFEDLKGFLPAEEEMKGGD